VRSCAKLGDILGFARGNDELIEEEKKATYSHIEWTRAANSKELSLLDRWAQVVGPPVIRKLPNPSATHTLNQLTFVVWNTNVGSADLAAFLLDLKQGRLTDGRLVEHFVLLLQEAHRSGPAVPDCSALSGIGATRIENPPRRGWRMGIDASAESSGLELYYVPSMRNGFPSSDEWPEDRGNAILSTLPLSRLRAFELPFERERRVAVAARVHGNSLYGTPWTLDWVNVHLDPRSAGWRFHRSFGAGRKHQTEWLLGVLEDEAPTLVAGDFNTWRGEKEPAFGHMRTRFRAMPESLEEGTLSLSPFLPAFKLDHVFFRLPGGWRSECRILKHTYGSDHRAIIGQISIE
jgi:endonuclease/exonuclease/phosphatase family metal-dependent hydrolase